MTRRQKYIVLKCLEKLNELLVMLFDIKHRTDKLDEEENKTISDVQELITKAKDKLQ